MEANASVNCSYRENRTPKQSAVIINRLNSILLNRSPSIATVIDIAEINALLMVLLSFLKLFTKL